MRHLQTIIAVILSTLSVTGQAGETLPELRQRIDSFFYYSSHLMIDRMLDITDPRLFSMVPRSQMFELLESSLKEPGMRIEFLSTDVDTIGAAIVHDTLTFVPIGYESVVRISLVDADDQSVDMMRMMAATMRTEDYEMDTVNYQITLRKPKLMFGVRYAGGTEWYLLEYQSGDNPLHTALMPPEMVARIDPIFLPDR